MTSDADVYGEMSDLAPGDDVLEELLAGRLAPAEVPPELAGLAAVFEAATGPAQPEELARQDVVVAAAVAEVRATVPPPAYVAGGRRKSRLVAAKVVAATVAALSLSTAVAAAAVVAHRGHGGGTPRHPATSLTTTTRKPFPSAVAPASAPPSHRPTSPSTSSLIPPHGGPATRTGHPVTATPAGTTPIAPTTVGPSDAQSQKGLCTAYLASDGGSARGSATAFRVLFAQHGGPAATTAYCHSVVVSHPANTSSPDSAPGQPADEGQPATSPASEGATRSSDQGAGESPGEPATPAARLNAQSENAQSENAQSAGVPGQTNADANNGGGANASSHAAKSGNPHS